jgi:hypothetical protein
MAFANANYGISWQDFDDSVSEVPRMLVPEADGGLIHRAFVRLVLSRWESSPIPEDDMARS